MATTPNTFDSLNATPSKYLGIIRFPSIALDNTAVRQALTMDIPVTDADVATGSRVEAKTRFALVPMPHQPGLSMAVNTDPSSGARFANTEAALAEQGFAFDLDGATPEAGDFHLYWRPTMAGHAPQVTPSQDADAPVALEHFAQPRMAPDEAPVADSIEMN